MSITEGYLSEADAAILKETKKDVIMGDPRTLVIIGLDTDDGPEHYLYDVRIKKPLVEETVRNIKLHGVTLPVQVIREKLENGESRLLVVDGRQRVRMAREANRRLFEEGQPLLAIPYQVKLMGKEADGKILLSLSLNAHRQDDDVATLCEKALHAVVKGVPKISVCNAMKISAGTLEKYTSIASEATSAVKNALRDGLIGVGQAFTLSKLSDAKQTSTLKEMLSAKAPPAESGDEGGNEEGGEDNEDNNEAASALRPERVKKEKLGLSLPELRLALLSKASESLSLEAFAVLSFVVGAKKITVAEEDQDTADGIFASLNDFLEAARIEAAQPKKRGRKPKAVAAATSEETGTMGTRVEKIDEDFSGHVDPRLSDPDDDEGDEGALDGGPDWSSQFDEDAENDPRESGENEGE